MKKPDSSIIQFHSYLKRMRLVALKGGFGFLQNLDSPSFKAACIGSVYSFEVALKKLEELFDLQSYEN